MRQYEWSVSFESGGPEYVVWAFCEEEATILAQAQRIKGGLKWRRIKRVAQQAEARRHQHQSLLA